MIKRLLPLLLLVFLPVCGQGEPTRTPPRLGEDFVSWFKSHAAFPREALEDGLTGKVLIVTDVLASGELRRPWVLFAPHWSICDNAMELTKQIRMIPATRNGKPVDDIRLTILDWCPGPDYRKDALSFRNVIELDYSLLLDSATLKKMTVAEQLSEPEFRRRPESESGKDFLGFALPNNLWEKWLEENYRAPEWLRDGRFRGAVKMKFTVGSDGEVSRPQVECDDPAIAREYLRLLTVAPCWESPAQVNGKAHRYTMRLTYDDLLDSRGGIDTREPLIICDSMPGFQGGDLRVFRDWTMRNLTLPSFPQNACKLNELNGVIVSFVVEVNGSVSHIKILQSPCEAYSEEVIRVVSSSPKWSPGIEDGKPVRVRLTIPVHFKLGYAKLPVE